MEIIKWNNNRLSKLSLGTVQFGLDYGIANKEGKPSLKEVSKIIDFLISKKLNCFDTAQGYGDSEKVLCKAISDKDKLYFISKMNSKDFQMNLNDNLDRSLSNLGLKSIFALLLHDSDAIKDWKDVNSYSIKELKERQKIKYFGISIYTENEFLLALENESIDIIQIPFNIFDLRALKNKWFEKAKKKNKLIFIRSIFLQGLLLMDVNDIPNKLQRVKPYLLKLNDIVNKYNISKNELLLSFVNFKAVDSILLFGCDNYPQAKENIELYRKLEPLKKEIIAEIIDEFSNIPETIYNPTKW